MYDNKSKAYTTYFVSFCIDKDTEYFYQKNTVENVKYKKKKIMYCP